MPAGLPCWSSACCSPARWAQPSSTQRTTDSWPWPAGLLSAATGVAALDYAATQTTWIAWIFLGCLYALLLVIDTALERGHGFVWRWIIRTFLALLAGLGSVAISQIESHFADEEFFVALQAVELSGLWLLLLLAERAMLNLWRHPLGQHAVRIDRRFVVLGLILLACLAGIGTVRAYQGSFYPAQAPTYPGISEATPFLCGQAQPDQQTDDGQDVFRRLLMRVEANPQKNTADYGLLALGTGNWHWAETFHTMLLNEMAAGRFTGPAQSVKFGQYDAALRVYYLSRVDAAFPGLFSSDERDAIQKWFAGINRRSLTVEWVDWMYALAFSKRPEGPYENQENGAGLLALLEATNLSSPDLSPINRSYLERIPRGWAARFRNTDDSFAYQSEWINNAYFQSLYTHQISADSQRLSFEWLLLQALPDGGPLGYNPPSHASLAGAAYLAASILNDPSYMWLAGQALQYAEQHGEYLHAQPGLEKAVDLEGRSPTEGSCLMYGDSGLPNQKGPLAPDKIVLRDGWAPDATYLLLNLRFTGWHRYKATNTATLVYQGGNLAADRYDSTPLHLAACRPQHPP